MLIGLNGRKTAGKDTVYERARRIMDGVIPVERVSFADLLYRSAAAALGVTVEDLQAWKSDPNATVSVGTAHRGHGMTVRQYLQNYGTEAHRDVFGQDFWTSQVNLAHAGKIVFVTDCRFKNEAEAVRAAGGWVVEVKGPREVEGAGDTHASETPLQPGLIDAIITNDVRDDGFRSLDAQVDTLLRLMLKSEAS